MWVNSDLYKNEPEEAEYHGKHNEGQYDMVDDIISMIIENTDESDGPKLKFSDFYEREKLKYDNLVGFEEAKNIIHDYAKINGIVIPSVF